MSSSDRASFLTHICGGLAAALLAVLGQADAVKALAATLGSLCKATGADLEAAVSLVREAYATTERT